MIDNIVGFLIGVGIAFVLAFGIIFMAITLFGNNDDYNSFRQACSNVEGAHMYELDISLCLTQDGRIVEVYP